MSETTRLLEEARGSARKWAGAEPVTVEVVTLSPAWAQVRCSVHGLLRDGQRYRMQGAKAAATSHRKRHHGLAGDGAPDAARFPYAAAAVEWYVRLDMALANGAPLPEQWTTVAVPTADEVADALAAVGMMMPIESAPVIAIARKVVEVMTARRSPRGPGEVEQARATAITSTAGVPARNIKLACGHPEGQAQLHRDELTAWCYNCEADVGVTKIPEQMAIEAEGHANDEQ